MSSHNTSLHEYINNSNNSIIFGGIISCIHHQERFYYILLIKWVLMYHLKTCKFAVAPNSAVLHYKIRCLMKCQLTTNLIKGEDDLSKNNNVEESPAKLRPIL